MNVNYILLLSLFTGPGGQSEENVCLQYLNWCASLVVPASPAILKKKIGDDESLSCCPYWPKQKGAH